MLIKKEILHRWICDRLALAGLVIGPKWALEYSISYYDNLIAQFEIGYQENFAKKEFKELYYVSESAEDAINYMKRYSPKQLPSKWF